MGRNLERKSPESSSLLEKNAKSTAWTSIYLCGLLAAIKTCQFTISFSSLWPYLRSMNPDFTESHLGYVIAAYSVSELFSDTALGYWSNKMNQVRLPLMTSFILMATGNFLYVCAHLAPKAILLFIMMLARFIIGAGAGNSALLRTHASAASSEKDRTRALAIIQGGMTVGTLAGSGIQLIFVPLAEEGFHLGPVTMNIYTMPTAFLVCFNILAVIIVATLFKDVSPAKKEKKDTGSKESRQGILWYPMLVCLATNFTHIFTLAVLETIISPYSMMMFSYSKEQSISKNSLFRTISGGLSVAIFFFFITFDFTKQLHERITSIVTQIAAAAMFIFTFSYPRGVADIMQSNATVPNCNATEFSWCETLTPTSPITFYFFQILVLGVAFPFMTIVVAPLYSKSLGTKKQGTLQGIYTMSGTVGRLIAPLIAGNLYSAAGPQAVWGIQIFEILAVLSLWFIFYQKLVT